MAVGMGMISGKPSWAAHAFEAQRAMADQNRAKVLEGVKNGSLNQDEFRDLACQIGPALPVEKSVEAVPAAPVPSRAEVIKAAATTQPVVQAPAVSTAAFPAGAMGMMPQQAFMAAQTQMYQTDMQQAQIVYKTIAASNQNFNGLYDKYSHGDFHPQVKLEPKESARLDQVYAKMKSGELTVERGVDFMHNG